MASTAGSQAGTGTDEELRALDRLADAIEENARDQRLLARRVRQLRSWRAKGLSWRHLLGKDGPPTVIDLLGRVLQRTGEVSAALRRRLARGLREEGVSTPTIGHLFGVSHQRISALLRDGPPAGDRRRHSRP